MHTPECVRVSNPATMQATWNPLRSSTVGGLAPGSPADSRPGGLKEHYARFKSLSGLAELVEFFELITCLSPCRQGAGAGSLYCPKPPFANSLQTSCAVDEFSFRHSCLGENAHGGARGLRNYNSVVPDWGLGKAAQEPSGTLNQGLSWLRQLWAAGVEQGRRGAQQRPQRGVARRRRPAWLWLLAQCAQKGTGMRRRVRDAQARGLR